MAPANSADSNEPTVTLQKYLERKAQAAALQPQYRERCWQCRKAKATCYCSEVAPIVTRPRIVILMHPMETKRAIATGRMAHRCLANSILIQGSDFSQNAQVNALIANPKFYPTVLYPGAKSRDVTHLTIAEKRELFPEGREPLLFVIDGTWHQAKKMLFRSQNLQALPRFSFMPSRPSGFKVRKQPHAQCFSTIEAIHELLGLLSAEVEPAGPKPRDILLSMFESMVEMQVAFRQKGISRHDAGKEKRRLRRERAVNAVGWMVDKRHGAFGYPQTD